MSARLTDEPRDTRLLEVDLRGLRGHPLVGRRVRLIFDTKLTFAGDPTLAKANPMFELWGEVMVSREPNSPQRQLGRMQLAEPVFVLPERDGGRYYVPRAELRLELDSRQLDEIEELRAGGGVAFLISLDGLVHVSGSTVRLNTNPGHIQYEASQSEWIKLLAQVEYGRYLTIEVELPRPRELHGELATAAESLVEAVEALGRGADEEAVADCREAFQALIRAAGGKPNAGLGDHGLTKDERFTYVDLALLNVANLAHHPNDKAATSGGDPIRWDRPDAQAVIATLASLIRRAQRS